MQIWFMPWADLGQELRLGPVIFWPFKKMAKSKIQDQSVLTHLHRYFGYYVDHRGQSVDTITICSRRTNDFRVLRGQKASDIRKASDALIFTIISDATKAAVCTNNRTLGPPSADRYELLTQNFQPGNNHLSIQAGSLLSGGWKIGDISFPMPWCLGGSFGSPNDKIIQGFDRAFGRGIPKDFRDRLFRALEWFRLAHTESDKVSSVSKVVMMATAFEIVLNLPMVGDKSGRFADELEKRCAITQSLRQTRLDRKGKNQTRAKVAWWGWDFYKLRNAIVHGDVIRPRQLKYLCQTRTWLSQLIVADLVFWQCVTKDLYDHDCIGSEARSLSASLDKLFPDEPSGSAEQFCVESFFQFDKVHRAFGWARKRTKKKKIKPPKEKLTDLSPA